MMKLTDKMTITLEDITDYLSGPIDEVVVNIADLKSEWPGYNLHLVVCKSYDDAWVELRGVRTETPEEAELRRKKEQRKVEEVLERKRKQYNRLKNELGL